MKKRYEKPTMMVVPLNGRTQLLAGSGDPDYWGYAPGIGTDENKLA